MCSRRAALSIALVAFFISGAAGLIYEVVWSRMLGLVFGNTSYAIATVVSAYMLGLGGGAYLIGRAADRFKNGLLLYAVLELCVGVYCYFTPGIFRGIEVAYVGAYRHVSESGVILTGIRFLLCFGALVVPTVLMGGTLPALSKFFVERSGEFGVRVGVLYGVNTLGAVAGCAGAGFVLLPALGVSQSIYFAVGMNCVLGVGVGAIGLGLRGEREREAEVEATFAEGGVLASYQLVLLLIGFSLSAFVSLAYEVAWTRAFSLAMGSSVYAFSAILAAFLLGIGVGSLLYSWVRVRSLTEDVRWFGGMQLGMSLSAILLLLPFGILPAIFGGILDRFHSNFALVVLSELGSTMLLVFIPSAIMGFSFPLVAGLAGPALRRIGGGVGIVYGVNTLGSVLGSLAAGFLLIPTVGIENTIRIGAYVNLIAGVMVIATHRRAVVGNSLAVGIVVIAAVALAAVIPPWRETVMVSGPFWATVGRGAAVASGSDVPGRKILYYKDGLSATVSVFEQLDALNPGVLENRWVSINGKPEASLMKVDMYNQLFLGHGPVLLARSPEKVFLIGLGSGITAGAISVHPEVKQLDCAEMERAMVEAAKFFRVENRDVLENPKTRLIVNDARNYLLATEEKYDVIVSEPSNPWMAGVANLFSREFLELCNARLTPDGLMCMWFHTYRMSDRDMKMIIRTFTTVFPNSSIWFAMPADCFLIGWKNPSERPSLAVVKQRLAGNRQADLDLASFHVFDPMALTACYLMGPDELQKFSAGAPLHTDDHPILEFSAPRYMFADTLARNFSELLKARARDPRPFADLTPAVKESAEFHYYSALALEYKDSRTMAAAEAEKAHELAPSWDDASVLWTRLEERRRQAQAKDDTQ